MSRVQREGGSEAYNVLELLFHVVQAEGELGDGDRHILAGRRKPSALRRLVLPGLGRIGLPG